MNIKNKLIVGSLLLAIVPVAITSVSLAIGSIANSEHALSSQAENQMRSISDTTAKNVEQYFETLNKQITTLATSNATIEAMDSFTRSFQRHRMYLRKATTEEEQKNSLTAFYQESFYPLHNELNQTELSVNNSFINELPTSNLSLQFSYISENPYAIGDKAQLLQSPFISSYDGPHNYYHPLFKTFAENFNIEDIYLIDIASETIVYSIEKDIDFATSMQHSVNNNSPLKSLFNQAKMGNVQQLFTSDSQPYFAAMMDNRIFMATVIMNSDKQASGVIVFEINHKQINQIVTHEKNWQQVGLGASGETFIIGTDARLRSEPRKLLESKADYVTSLQQTQTTDVINEIDRHNSAINRVALKADNVLQAIAGNRDVGQFDNLPWVFSAYRPLKIQGLNWFIVSEMHSSEVLSSVEELRQSLTNIALLSTFIASGLALLATLFFIKSILKPINQTVDLVTNIAQGKGDLRQRLNRQEHDELGALSNGFDLFVSKLQSMFKIMSGNVNSLVDSSKTLQLSADQTKKLSQLKHQEIKQAAQSIEIMQASAQQVFNGLQQAYHTTNESLKACDTGVSIIETTKNANLQLRKQLDHTASVVEKLSADSTEITHVLSVIETIAEQTNLLALNAAIESARAGELGRGFAVVADEVRALAQRTQQSTGQIKQIIQRLELGSDNAITAMKKSQNNSEQAVGIAEDAADIFQKINNFTKEMGTINQLISEQSQEQKQSSLQVQQNINNIEEISNTSNEDALQLSNASAQLAQLSDQIYKLIKAYKI